MSDDSRTERPADDPQLGGISRRQLLGVGALGLAGTLFSPPPASGHDDDRDHPRHWGRAHRLLHIA